MPLFTATHGDIPEARTDGELSESLLSHRHINIPSLQTHRNIIFQSALPHQMYLQMPFIAGTVRAGMSSEHPVHLSFASETDSQNAEVGERANYPS